MEDHHVNVLLRRVARQSSRRAALTALMAGAVAVAWPETGEANKEAKRRRKRRQRARSAETTFVGVTIFVKNASSKTVVFDWGGYGPLSCCAPIDGWVVSPGYTASAGRPATWNGIWVWIDETWWFHVQNPMVGAPHVQIALNGKFPDRACCAAIPTGLPVEKKVSFKPKQSRAFNIDGKVFTVARDADAPTYKGFTITLPTDL